jgi:hypothetical protein
VGDAVVPQWIVPNGMTGDPTLVRIGPKLAGDEDYGCPAFNAAKARPAIIPKSRLTWPKPRLETFPLGPIQALLDRIEFGEAPVEKVLDGPPHSDRPLHPGLAQFVRHAVSEYVAKTDIGLTPVRPYWVVQRENDFLWELYAWGRRYESVDRGVREFRFLRFGVAGSREREPAQIAIAAYTTAFGSPASWPQPWSAPFSLRPESHTVEQVRVVEAGMIDGSRAVLFDGTVAEAEEYYAQHAREQVAMLVGGIDAVPGSACNGCKVLTACDGPTKAPGLLGVPAGRAPLRKVSVSDLRYYRACPAQLHLRSLNLPKQYEYSDEAERGQAVHLRLELNHRNALMAKCLVEDVKVDPKGWTAGRWSVSGEQALIGARMLSHHLGVCPLDSPVGVTEVRVEPTLTFYDTAANVIVLAKPDLLYLEGGAWVWRETKTTEKDKWFHDDLLDEFPQLALAVLILSRGLLGGNREASRIELETLRPHGADISLVDPTDPERVAKATCVISSLARPWHGDGDYQATPGNGRVCQSCPVSLWCPSFSDNDQDGAARLGGGLVG